MKLSFSTLGCPEWGLDEIVRNAAAYGYDGVELRTHDGGVHFKPGATLDEGKAVAAKFRDAGVPIMSLKAYTSFAAPDEAAVKGNAQVLAKVITLAAAMQVPFIRSFIGGLPKGADRKVVTAQVVKALQPLARQAADAGVRIGLETHDDWCRAECLLPVVQGVGSPALGVVYDIFNALTGTTDSWETTYATVKPYLCYCHVKDGWVGADQQHHYCMMGAGDLPYPAILARFKADGYAGFLSLEWEKMWIPELETGARVFPHYVHKMRQLWARA